MPKPDIFSRGPPSKLPEAYRKFYEEWIAPQSPVHYINDPDKWKRNSLTGEVTPVQNVPIPVRLPKEAHTGIWGGEGVILGFIQPTSKRNLYIKPDITSKWWVPTLFRSVVYTEILDKRLSVIVTKRTINLVMDHKGFDNYLLETPANDLKSLLALKLKKKMLLALFDKTLYPEDPAKQELIYNKYKHHLENYNKEDLQWYALSIGEAVKKMHEIEDAVEPTPLKQQFRAELIEELKYMAETKELDKIMESDENKNQSWINRINPFAKKT